MSNFAQDAPTRKDWAATRCSNGWAATKPIQPTSILLVDDDDQLRGLCCKVLMANGFTVLEASNSCEALLTSVQRQGAIDLLITDLEMPGINGMQLGRAFNELWPSVNVLYISGSPRDCLGNHLTADCAFLLKPFAPNALINAVGSALVRGHDTAQTFSNLP